MNSKTPAFPIILVLTGIAFLFCFCGETEPGSLQEAPEPAPDEMVTDSRSGVFQTGQEQAGEPIPETAEDLSMVPLDVQLPQPRFVGTPQTMNVPDYEDRPYGRTRPAFYVPAGTRNLALDCPVTSSDTMPVIGELGYITNGDKEAQEGSYVELGPFLQHVIIELETPADIYAVAVWHNHLWPRIYYDVIVQISPDPAFQENVYTIFNNDHDNSAGFGAGKDRSYVETYQGRIINARGIRGRYIRLYSNGSNYDDLNHYSEVEVYGIPVSTS